MATPELTTEPKATPAAVPPLEPGDHLDQKTFHTRYEAMPEDVIAELIGGVVYMPSPLKASQGDIHGEVMAWLKQYKAATPGTRVLDNATVILAEDSEPQPDACLLIRPEVGGQTRENEDGYIVGPPELVVEVALSSESYDRHSKLRDYERYGVRNTSSSSSATSVPNGMSWTAAATRR
jgi:Uma2 family endonuclease